MNNINTIASKISVFTLATYLVTFIVLIILSSIYIKKVSIPLVNINEKTKKLSNLDFEISMDEYQSDDEIGQLSHSINILSTNLKNALEDLKLRNSQLSEAIERESNRDQQRKDFVTGVSHELKTPLSIIQASTEAIEYNIFNDEQEIRNQFNVIKNEINRSNQLISQMLNIYKLDQPEFQSEWKQIDLKSITQKVYDSQINLADTKNIKIELNAVPYYIDGDENKIEIAVSNILSNAIKYTPENEIIYINIDDQGLTIINTGISIPDEELKNLFEPFYRVDKSKSRKDGSSGLGLYIVKQILNQHDLFYKIENIEKGVKFSLRK